MHRLPDKEQSPTDSHVRCVGQCLTRSLSLPGSNIALQLVNAVARMAGAAISALDLQEHEGSHPRLGVVDHISCHPLGSASLSMAAETARSLGESRILMHAYKQTCLLLSVSSRDGYLPR